MSDEALPGHIPDERLHDYVDGALGPEEKRAVELHLTACLSCRRDEEALRGLTADLAALPKEIPPLRDLRPGIAERIAASSAPSPRQAIHVLRYPLAAAAILLVVATTWITAALVGGGANGPAAEAPGDDAPARSLAVTVDLGSLEAAYLPAIRQLAEALERRRSELSPETVRTLEHNLRVIDRAIEESRRALAADPGDRVLRELLVGSYEAKVEFLTRAAALTARS